MSSIPLSSAELKQCRDIADQYLPGTAILLSQTTVSDGQGGYVDSYAASGTVDARLAFEKLRGGEAAVAGRLAEVGSWILTVPANSSLEETGRVTFNSVTYDVVEVLTRTPEEVSRRIRLKEVD